MPNYILAEDGKTPIIEPDSRNFEKWYVSYNRSVLQTTLEHCRVSTVFLGIDHNFRDSGDPILWETMVFPLDDANDLDVKRYTSYDDAVAGHNEMVEKFKKEEKAGESAVEDD